ncbi:MAG: ABC transporter permease [Tyzzerella sp.]|nr:ABC transporter permease [Tyzzerella sp.]
MIAIYKRELKSYFQSMIGYAFITFLMLFTGVYFTAYNLNAGYPYFAYTLSASMLIFLIAVPVLTMKSFAEERKSKTDQLLLTAPVSVTGIVLGKYLAMVTVFLIPCLLYCIYPLVIKMWGTAYLKVDYASIFMFFLIGCVYIAVGMFLSSLTESQIIAAVSTFAALLVMYLWSGLINFLPTDALGNFIGLLAILLVFSALIYQLTKNWMIGGGLAFLSVAGCVGVYFTNQSAFESLLYNMLQKLDFSSMFSNVMSSSLLDMSSVVLCISIVFLFVFITIQTIQKRRWS